MSEQLPGLTRRSVLSAAAAGAAIVALPSIARAGAPTGTSAAVDTSDLELRALELEPPVFLFETHVPEQVRALDGSRLSISGDVARAGEHSLRWDYQPGAAVEVRTPLHYQPSSYRPGGDQGFAGTVDTFSLWLYNDRPTDDVLRVEFGRGDVVDAWCEIHLGFRGWRTAWIRYGYDLSGSPRQGTHRTAHRPTAGPRRHPVPGPAHPQQRRTPRPPHTV